MRQELNEELPGDAVPAAAWRGRGGRWALGSGTGGRVFSPAGGTGLLPGGLGTLPSKHPHQ